MKKRKHIKCRNEETLLPVHQLCEKAVYMKNQSQVSVPLKKRKLESDVNKYLSGNNKNRKTRFIGHTDEPDYLKDLYLNLSKFFSNQAHPLLYVSHTSIY